MAEAVALLALAAALAAAIVRHDRAPEALVALGGAAVLIAAGILSWVEAGGVYAVAQLRGGGEEGEDWHRAGMLGTKQNVFDDFHAAAEHLVAAGWTTPEQLAISGGSDNGAFTAGFLNGWTKAGTRPEFKLVTGVSTGALIAPFAFLGPAYDETLKSIYTSVSRKDIAVDRAFYSVYLGDAMADTTPLAKMLKVKVTQKMVDVQDALGPVFGAKIAFVSITLDPEHDTPEVLKDYAQFWGAKPEGWTFLTGSLEAVRDVTRRYGVFFLKKEDGSVEHSQLTTLVDGDGQMRVQYLGARFDPEEFRQDLMSLVDKE